MLIKGKYKFPYYMKQLFTLAICAFAITACYNARALVGDIAPKEPVVEINKEWNHHLIYGSKRLCKYMNFLNLLASAVT